MRSPPFSIPNDRTSCFTHTEDADNEDDEEAAAAAEEEEEEEDEEEEEEGAALLLMVLCLREKSEPIPFLAHENPPWTAVAAFLSLTCAGCFPL